MTMDDKLVANAEEQINHLYLLINVAVRRAEQILEGAAPAVVARNMSPIEVALREIEAGKIEADEEDRTFAVQPADQG